MTIYRRSTLAAWPSVTRPGSRDSSRLAHREPFAGSVVRESSHTRDTRLSRASYTHGGARTRSSSQTSRTPAGRVEHSIEPRVCGCGTVRRSMHSDLREERG